MIMETFIVRAPHKPPGTRLSVVFKGFQVKTSIGPDAISGCMWFSRLH